MGNFLTTAARFLAKNFDKGEDNKIAAYKMAQAVRAQQLQNQQAEVEIARAPTKYAQEDEAHAIKLAYIAAGAGGISLDQIKDPRLLAMGRLGVQQQGSDLAINQERKARAINLTRPMMGYETGAEIDPRELAAGVSLAGDTTQRQENAANRAMQREGWGVQKEIAAMGAANRPGARPKVSEAAALTFFGRAQKAEEDLDTIADSITKMGVWDRGRLAYTSDWANFTRSEAMQKYLQAQRAFTEARLRKDSGAAIPEQEFENDRKMYFVQPGDTPETIEQKRRGRGQILAGLAYAAGPALQGFYGEEAEPLLESLKTRAGGVAAPGTGRVDPSRVVIRR